jgi:hypothetical protein
VDFDVEPCQKNYGKIKNYAYENGIGQLCKPTNYVEL